jgi:hypothetical protein
MKKIFEIKEYRKNGFGRNRGVDFVAGKKVNLETVGAECAKVYRENRCDEILTVLPIEKQRTNQDEERGQCGQKRMST